MSDVDFNDEHKPSVLYSRFQSSTEVPTLVRWLMSSGVAKTNEAANKVLLGIAVVAVAVALFIIYKVNSPSASNLNPAQVQQMQQMQPVVR